MESPNGDELFRAHILVMNQTLSLVGSLAFKSAAELGIADIIQSHGRPVSLSELARSIPIPPEKDGLLARLMRLLVSRSVFAQAQPGPRPEHEPEPEPTYSLTPISRLLLANGVNMSAYIEVLLDEPLVRPLFLIGDLLKREGGAESSTSFEAAHSGIKFWDFMNERPEMRARFAAAMAANTHVVAREIVDGHREVFRGLRSLVDVGGGTGTAAKMIAETFPGIKCTVFDLPQVVGALPENETVDAVGGSMFDFVPPADAAFLKSVLHDHGDEDCVKILKRCKEAIPSRREGGKVIIVDIVVNSRPDDRVVTETQLFYDMLMMSEHGGKEREEHEWRKIFDAAGFTDYKMTPLLTVQSIFELYP